MKDLQKKENQIEKLQLSKRKKEMFKESHQIFAELRLKSTNDYQKKVTDRAEKVIEEWTNFETLLFETDILEEEKTNSEDQLFGRKKRETDLSCCKQLKLSKSGTDPDFPEEHEPYFEDIFTLQPEGANGYNLYKGEADREGKSRIIRRCADIKAWMIRTDENLDEDCEGSFAIRSDQTCPENFPTTGWIYTDTDTETTAWPTTSLNIKVECFEEPEENNEVIVSKDPEPEQDFESFMLHDIFKLMDQLKQVSTYVENEQNKPRCSLDAQEAFKIAEKLVDSLEKRLDSMTVEGTVAKRSKVVEHLKFFLAAQAPKDFPKITLPNNYKPPIKKCFIEWGRNLLNDVLEDKYFAIIEDVAQPKDCFKYCRKEKDQCFAWSYDDKEKFCFLKSRDMATRFSETWQSNIWSVQMDSCTSEDMKIEWKRSCNMPEYLNCIRTVVETLQEEGETPEESHLNSISPRQRRTFDTFNDEINCIIDFCPWTPEIDMEALKERSVKASVRFLEELLGPDVNHCEEDEAKNPPGITKAEDCDIKLNYLVFEDKDGKAGKAYLKNDDVSAFADAAFQAEILPQLKDEERIYIIHLMKEKAIALMEAAQTPQIVIEDTQQPTPEQEWPKMVKINVDSKEEKKEDKKDEDEKSSPIKPGVFTPPACTPKQPWTIGGHKIRGRYDCPVAAPEPGTPEATGATGTTGTTGAIVTASPPGSTGNSNAGNTGNAGNAGNAGNTGNAGNAGNNGNAGSTGRPRPQRRNTIAVNPNRQTDFGQEQRRSQSLNRAVQRVRTNNPGGEFNRREFRQNVRSQVMPFHRVVRLKQQMNNYNQYTQKKKAFNQKVQGVTDKGSKLAGGVIQGVQQGSALISAIKNGDGIGIATGVLGMVAMGAAFFPPIGTAVAALAGIASAILGAFQDTPSDLEIITGLIEDQTTKIENMIEEQTKVLLFSIEKLAEQNEALAKFVVNQFLVESYYQMRDDINGVNTALKIKMEHVNLYKDTCVLSWTDLASEADMNEVNLQFGRIGSYMQRFCANKKNMNFCGQLVFQYVLMASLRDMVRLFWRFLNTSKGNSTDIKTLICIE